MHICFLSNEFPEEGIPHGGIGSFLKTFTQQLIKNGHIVTVIGFGKKCIETDECVGNLRVIRTARPTLKGFRWLQNVSRMNDAIIRVNNEATIDILEGQEGTFAFVKNLQTVPRVIRMHGGHYFFAEGENRGINLWKGFLEKRSFKNATAFIAVSNYVKEHTAKYLKFTNRPCIIINYPISFDTFYRSDPKKSIPFTLVFAGTVCEKKGVRQLIAALPKVAELFPEVHLHIYGRDWLFPNKKSYITFLKEQFDDAILSKVTFHGAVPHNDLPAIYESAELCVFPSHIETQGLVAPEAMAMEKPVLFSKTGPGPETIVHGETGWLCDPHDSDNIANTIIECLKSKDHYSEIGKKAREFALFKFNPNKILQENLNFYKNLLN